MGDISMNYIFAEDKKRTITRVLTYRVAAFVTLFIISYLFTGKLIDSSLISVIFNLVATIIHYFHERLWLKIGWGINRSS